MRISLSDVQRNISNIANRAKYTPDVLYELLAAYGRSASAITQLQSGHLNKAESSDAVLQKDVVYFRTFSEGTQLEIKVQELFEDPLTERYKPRYLIATDLINLAAKDTIKGTMLTIKLSDIDNELDFFYAWTGDEIVDTKTEAVADRRAADKMNELYLEIEKENRDQFLNDSNFRHKLNVFFTRLLFCFFAEDTGIYEEKQFTNAIKTFTQIDGSDLSWFFEELFKALDTKDVDKTTLKVPFKDFPYVNGSIFNTSKHSITIPRFSAQSRHLILECGRQNWGEINPDIFGTMFQGIVDPNSRDENGMDYTSVPNIMKVINPLFLDELRGLFDRYYSNEQKLWNLLNRISAIKIFDPACGSGNFLIITYKELRQLQHAIIGRIDELKPGGLAGGIPSSNLLEVDHLYGIEIDDFARELAILSIFLAKHQMNMKFNEQFGTSLAIIPLIELNTIVQGNAARLDWKSVCQNIGHTVTQAEQSTLFDIEGDQVELSLGTTIYDEIYLIGNPPYKGSKLQSKSQKVDFTTYFSGEDYSKNLDYIAIWFIKGARFITGTRAKLAFVSTNSVCQGEHVSIMFPKIFDEDVEIGFAYSSFKWQNSARDNAGVAVIVLGLRNKQSNEPKYIFTDGICSKVQHINTYLIDSEQNFVSSKSKPISQLPKIAFGSMPIDDGNLVVTQDERDNNPSMIPYLKQFIGAAEFINGRMRYCLWIPDNRLDDARQVSAIELRLVSVAKIRSDSKRKDTNKLAATPWRFGFISYKPTNSIIVPSVSSERREYIPMGFLDEDTVISNAANAIYDAEPWIFALLQSKMHMIWIRTVCGQLETRIRYSATLGYNTFPVNPLTQDQKDELSKSARKILLVRATYPEKTLADMYDPDKMPTNLREAHNENDHLVDSLYKKTGFKNDEERLVVLFDLYEIMTEKEKTK